MRFEGRVFRSGRYWAIKAPILSIVTQDRTKKEAFEMIADAIEVLVNKPDFEVRVFPGEGEYFAVGASDEATLTAFLLQREQTKSGLTLAQVAQRLGSKSLNTYARYEQGRTVPTVPKLSELLSALASGKDFVLTESRARYSS
jgi:predicted RNase H-like HicB family nuclease